MTPTMVYGSSFSVTTRPSASASAPNRRRHRSSLMIAIRSPPGRPSPVVKSRPSRGVTPSIENNPRLTCTAATRSGSASPVTSNCTGIADSNRSKSAGCACQPAIFSGVKLLPPPRVLRLVSSTSTRRSAWMNGAERSSNWSTTLNTVVAAPIPTPTMAMRSAVCPGRARSRRIAI
jgi:hypothetical protein